MIRKHLLFFIYLFFSLPLFSQQNIISGKVIDNDTKEPLAFVNIIINNGKYGGTSDIDGKFKLSSSQHIKTLNFSYVGYQSKIFNVVDFEKKNIIKLKRIEIALPEFVVFPIENPAHRIINNAVANKKTNNPENLKSFSYTAYDKMIFTADLDSLMFKDTALLDTSEMQVRKFFTEKNIFILETITKRKFLAPDHNSEKVIATKMSGFHDPVFVFMISQMQSTSFYDDVITIMDKNYINPISKGSTKKYFFLIEDTTYTVKDDTVFIISYRPRKNTNFDALKGVLSINSNAWAIQNVIAGPAIEESGISAKIQQRYEQMENSQWFPVQLNTNLILNNAKVSSGKKAYRLLGIGKSYLEDIVLNPNLVKKEFKRSEIEVKANAHKQSNVFWENYRPNELSEKDKQTYEFIDSLGKAKNFDLMAKSFESIMLGNIPWGFIDFNIDKFMHYNSFEGYYLGLGLQSNKRLSKYFKLGGYWGYGFMDKSAKYGFNSNLLIDRHSELEVDFSYCNDLLSSGNVNFFDVNASIINPENFREFLIKRMNNTESWNANLKLRLFKYMKFYTGITHNIVDAYGDYKYKIADKDGAFHYKNTFNFTELKLGIRYAYKESFLETKNSKVSLGTNYPIVKFLYTRGLNGFLNGEYSFNRYDLKIEDSFYMKYFGEFSFNLTAGYIDGDLPYCNLYNGNGSYRTFTIYAPNSFATMRMNEFLSNKYVALYFKHDFGKLLFRTKYFKPEIALATNIAFGSLNNPEKHINSDIKTLEKGYYESGILINNILNLGVYSVGVAGFYRYGPYSLDKTSDNFAWKFTLTFPF